MPVTPAAPSDRRVFARRPRAGLRAALGTALALLVLAPAGAGAASSRHPAVRVISVAGTARTIPAGISASTVPPLTSGQLQRPPSDFVAPPGYRLDAVQAVSMAAVLPKIKAVRDANPGSYAIGYIVGPGGRWQASFFSKSGKEIGQVLIDDASARVLEQWTGFQVAWSMARGYPGAFGRHVSSLYVWLPLCALFLVPLVDRRRRFSLLTLDLLALLFFSVPLAFFNHARLDFSTPLTYPPLVYLLVRMLFLGRVGRRHAISTSELRELRPLAPVGLLAVGVIFLLGFRVALNVTDSNVIDVGYAGVVGAHRIVAGESMYGSWPKGIEQGDTYGPLTYEAYVPFERTLGFSGRWDDLPAAHGAAIFFDVLCVLLIFLLGRRVRGPTLGVVLAYAWVSYPFTLYALESNSNDELVAAMVLLALLAATFSPVRAAGARLRRGGVAAWLARGGTAALAGLTKFAPLALAPVLATHGLQGSPRERVRRGALFGVGFLALAGIVLIPALEHDSLREIYDRTISYQAGRSAPFSVWGYYGGLGIPHTIVEVLAVLLALAVAVLPRRADVVGLAAVCAAILIAIQLCANYWFFLYIPWFVPGVLVGVFGRFSSPARDRRSAGAARYPQLAAAA